MAVYRRLATRFHCTPDDLADRLAATEARLERLERDETDLRSLDGPLMEAWSDLKRSAAPIIEASPETRQGLPLASSRLGSSRSGWAGLVSRSRLKLASWATIRWHKRRPIRGPIRSRCSSPPNPGEIPARCERLPQGASCRD